MEFVPGRPNVYGLFYPNVRGWYVGRSETGDGAQGNLSEALRRLAMLQDGARR